MKQNIDYGQVESYPSPAYFYYLSNIEQQIKSLQEALSNNISIFYSMKANSHPRVLDKIQQMGLKIDVASQGELQLALEVGFSGKDIEFTGPGKSKEALTQAIQNRISYIVVESISELFLVNELSGKLGLKANILVRVHPNQIVQPNGKLRSINHSQFGIDVELMPEFFESLIKCENIEFKGCHIFSQSQYLNEEYLIQNFYKSLETIRGLFKYHEKPFEVVNLGGGFGIPYYQNDKMLNIQKLKEDLVVFINELKNCSKMKDTKLFIESGRYIVGPSGYYCAKILYTKISRGKKIHILNGGFSHHMGACGFGQIIKKNFIIDVIQKSPTDLTEEVTLVGPSCYSLDVVASDISLPKLDVGDYISIRNSGSYGLKFSPQNFLLLDKCSEIIMECK